MKELVRLIVVLTAISAGAGLMLAYTNKVTAKPIAAARAVEKNDALRKVLPPFDNDPATTTNAIRAEGAHWVFNVARQGGQFVGAAFESASRKGYGGEIRILVGVSADGRVLGYEVLAQQETPGLGTKIADAPFKPQFANKPIDGTTWRVKKDGGDFDAITGATISSRAVLDAVQQGLKVYSQHRDAIARTGE